MATWAIALAVVLLSLLLVVRVSALRAAAQRRDEELRRFRAQWEPILNGPPQHIDRLPPIRSDDVLPWMLMWNQAQENVCMAPPGERGKREYLNDIALRKDMPVRALQWAHRRDVVDRLEAVTMLGHLRETSAVPVLRMLCDSANPLVSVAAARALLQIDPPFADRFVLMMAEHGDWPQGKLVTIVQSEREALQAPLLDICRTAPPAVSRGLVQYLRYADPQSALPILRHLLDTVTDVETLTAALKVVADIGVAADAALIAKFTTNENWRVRVRAANALAALGDESHVETLAKLLGDTHWWVRYRAAQALGSISERCKTDLTPILQNQQDRFAREALAEVVAERTPLLQGVAVS